MANPQRSEATFTVEGKTYTLVHSLHAWAVTQDALSTRGKVPSLQEIQQKLGQESLIHIIATFYGMLQSKHPEISTVEQASDLLAKSEQAGTKAMLAAMGFAVPDQADVQELAEGASSLPQRAAAARRGTGAANNSRHAPSV